MLSKILRAVQFAALLSFVILTLFLGVWIYDADTRSHSVSVGQNVAELFFDNTYLTFVIYSPSNQPEGTVLDWGGREALPGWEVDVTVADGLAPDWKSRGQMFCLFLRIWWPIVLLNLSAIVFVVLSFILPSPAWLPRLRRFGYRRSGFPVQTR